MKIRFLLALLFTSTALSAQTVESRILVEPAESLPVTARLNREEVDRYQTEAYVITAGEQLTLSGGLSHQWRIPLITRGKALTFELGNLQHVACELRIYPVGTYALGGWEDSLPVYLEAAQENPANAKLRFKTDAAGAIAFMLPRESRGREIRGADGEIVFSDKRTVYPTLWGSPYYIVEYAMTENENTEEAQDLKVSELFLSTRSSDVHLIFRSSEDSHFGLFRSLFSYLKGFYIVGQR